MAIRVVVADDHPLFLFGVRRTLDDAEGIEVVGEATTGPQAVSIARRLRPDVVLMDLRMPGLDGLACLTRIQERSPKTKVIIFSACTDEAQIAAAFRHGACAYVVKSAASVDLVSAIRQAKERTVYQPEAVGLQADVDEDHPAAGVELTERELTVLEAVARGLSNKAVGEELWVTEKTVKFHLSNVYRKLGVTSRTSATRFAHQHGLVDSMTTPPS